ncbi:MAG: FAD-binding oxidoreductase, partial [Acidimicrobiales bacterium]
MPAVGPEQTIVQARTTGEVARALRDAAERGDVVVARGAGTKQNWGGPLARQPDTILDLSGHDAVLEYEPGDLVVRVAAGCPLATLQATIGEHGQRLSIDEVVPGSTIGGVLATGASGPLRHRFGTPRDLILGATVVLADGTVTKSGSKVVKNVAGYDLARLHTGAFGTLGIIAEATFRLHPLTDARRWVTAIAADEAALRQALATTHASLDDLAAVEVDRAAGEPVTAVCVLLEGTTTGVEARASRLVDELRTAGVASDQHISGEPPPWWGHLPAGDVARLSV